MNHEELGLLIRQLHINPDLVVLAKQLNLTDQVSFEADGEVLCSAVGRSGDGKWHRYDWSDWGWREAPLPKMIVPVGPGGLDR